MRLRDENRAVIFDYVQKMEEKAQPRVTLVSGQERLACKRYSFHFVGLRLHHSRLAPDFHVSAALSPELVC